MAEHFQRGSTKRCSREIPDVAPYETTRGLKASQQGTSVCGELSAPGAILVSVPELAHWEPLGHHCAALHRSVETYPKSCKELSRRRLHWRGCAFKRRKERKEDSSLGEHPLTAWHTSYMFNLRCSGIQPQMMTHVV